MGALGLFGKPQAAPFAELLFDVFVGLMVFGVCGLAVASFVKLRAYRRQRRREKAAAAAAERYTGIR